MATTPKQPGQNRKIEGEGSYQAAEEYDREASEFARAGQADDTAEASGADASGGVEGEGSYDAAREYGRGVSEFVRSGRVEGAAEEAEFSLDQDPQGLREAEQIGKSRGQDLGWEGASQASEDTSSPGLDRLDPDARHRALERINKLMEEGYSERQAQRIAMRLAEDWVDLEQSSNTAAVHVVHERNGWVIHAKDETLDAIFDRIDDALRRAHEIAAEMHVPLLVHGLDGALIDKYDA
jgi:uncharacterized protein YdaT